jgi:hypothetical protein
MVRGWYGEVFENFCGKHLQEIAVSNDGETTLRFVLETNDGFETRYVTTDGDCCSVSWWADVIGAYSAYGGLITCVKSLDLPQNEQERSRQEEDRVYGYEITTDFGAVTLAFRNSSNGYYGGTAYDVDFENADKIDWSVIETNNWRA